MIMEVKHWDEQTDGQLSEQAMRKKLKALGYLVNCYVYAPGTVFPEHTHDVDKIDGVLSGQFKMSMHGKEVILQAGDCLEVPRGAVHYAEVIGNEPVISLDAIKQ